MNPGESDRQRHRLFVAIELPEHLHLELDALQDDFEGARWVPPANRHLTLRFIGEVNTKLRETILRSLGTIEAARIELDAAGLTILPSYRRPRILALAMTQNSDLSALQQNVEDVLQMQGLEPETKPFRPHITMARLRRVSSVSARRYVNAASWIRASFTASRFVLFESHRASNGVSYEALAVYPLA